MTIVLSAANVVLGIVNVVLFALWVSMIKIDALPEGGKAAEYALSQLSVGVAILGIIVTAAALILAALGAFGFQSIKDSATTRADQTAREAVNQYLASIRTTQAGSAAASGPSGTLGANLPNTGNATPETDT